MPGIHCKRHTPITSERQRRLFGAIASGQTTKATGLSRAEARRHLKEVEGKDLPAKRGLKRLAHKIRGK